MRSAIYLRISDDREGQELGITRQSDECRELAAREGLTVVSEHRENDTGASTRSRKPRPRYDQMLADARAGLIQVIVAYSSSRLTRRPRELEDLIDLATANGITYRFVRSPSFDLNTADGRMVARTLAAADAAEAERTAERVSAAARQRAVNGRAHGGPEVFGVSGGQLVPEQAERIQDWAESVLAGSTVYSIAAALNREAVPSPGGGRWRGWVIRRILLNPAVAGFRLYDGMEYATPHPAILEREVWEAVCHVLSEPRRRPGTSTARKWPGVGLYRCDRCDTPVSTGQDRAGNRLYRCARCWRQWRAGRIDGFVDLAVEEQLGRPDLSMLLPVEDAPDMGGLRTELTAARRRLVQLAEQFADGDQDVDVIQLRVASRRLRGRISELEAQLTEAGRSGPLIAVALAEDPVQAWRDTAGDLDRRRAVLSRLLVVRLGAPIRGRAPWDPRKVMGESRWTWSSTTWAETWASGR
jgi:site-specific DNA recombinase